MGNRLCWDAVSGKPSRSARCTLCEQSLLTRFGNDLIESWEKLEGPLGGGTLEERILREGSMGGSYLALHVSRAVM